MDYDALYDRICAQGNRIQTRRTSFSAILTGLKAIASGKIQLIYSGKAHPKDDHGKWLIENHVIKEKLKRKD